MKKFTQSLLLASLITSGWMGHSACAEELYRWQDAEGNVSYGNAPPTDSDVTNVEKVDEKLPPLINAPAVQIQPTTGIASSQKDKSKQTDTSPYEAITIVQPEHDSSVRENAGNVTIAVQTAPALNVKAGHLLAIYLDGKEITVGTSYSVTIPNVDRGTHEVQAKILNDRGKAIDSSATTTFTLHRHSVLN